MFHSRSTKNKNTISLQQCYLRPTDEAACFKSIESTQRVHSRRKNPHITLRKNSSAFAKGAEIGWTLRRKSFFFMCEHKGKWARQWRWKGQGIMKHLRLKNFYHPIDTHAFQLMLKQVFFPPLVIILNYMLLTIWRISILQ